MRSRDLLLKDVLLLNHSEPNAFVCRGSIGRVLGIDAQFACLAPALMQIAHCAG